MKGRTKAIIGIIAGLLLLTVIVVAGVAGYMYVSFTGKNETARSNGVTFGQSSDESGCIDESLRQFRDFKENTFSARYEQLHIHFFTRGCLETARPVSTFCDDLPKERGFIAKTQWGIDKCGKIGLDKDGPCNEIFKEIITKCDTKK